MKNFTKKASILKTAGDKLERLGEKITNSGAAKIGRVVYDIGNKLEHRDDQGVDPLVKANK